MKKISSNKSKSLARRILNRIGNAAQDVLTTEGGKRLWNEALKYNRRKLALLIRILLASLGLYLGTTKISDSKLLSILIELLRFRGN